ncbi:MULTISPECIES: hypothetical protein [Methanothermobacter]|uniref:hypothetical protein n=1 Tax=Methanothermobacter TaxID=145260 RepID=UPI0011C8EF87|nr:MULTISPECIES: hypothetical protein [unclassified Methanothermobacter]QEF94148.1 hypothetical protein FVF72_02620 [Methanothermobacter sp. KEPCO-1]QHN08431.1 hypothetical protein FZP68_06640 [Methanothermobacter sp. THM-2]
MIEVEGMMSEENPVLITFDGKFLELFFRSGMKFKHEKYPIKWIKKLEIKDEGKSRTLNYTMNFLAPVGFFPFESGGENLQELVDAVNRATGAF